MKIKILSMEQIEQKYGSTIDTTPTQNSTNLITSGGVYSAIPSTSDFVTKTGSQSISNKTITSSTYNGYSLGSQCQKSYTTSVTDGSSALVTSGAVYTQISNIGGLTQLSSQPTWSNYLSATDKWTLTVIKDFTVLVSQYTGGNSNGSPILVKFNFRKGEKYYYTYGIYNSTGMAYGCGQAKCIGISSSGSHPVYVYVGTIGGSSNPSAGTIYVYAGYSSSSSYLFSSGGSTSCSYSTTPYGNKYCVFG